MFFLKIFEKYIFLKIIFKEISDEEKLDDLLKDNEELFKFEE
jgi:hypothetical protein